MRGDRVEERFAELGLGGPQTQRILHRDEVDDAGSDTSSTHTWPSSAATSEYSIHPQDHCVERQDERKVTVKEIQRVVKHGIRQPDPRGNLKRRKRTFEGVTVITQGKRIITTWREMSYQQPATYPSRPSQPAAPYLPVVKEDGPSRYDPWYGGMVHDEDPFDYSDPGARYFAWKDGGDDDLLLSNDQIRQRRDVW